MVKPGSQQGVFIPLAKGNLAKSVISKQFESPVDVFFFEIMFVHDPFCPFVSQCLFLEVFFFFWGGGWGACSQKHLAFTWFCG